MEGYKTNKMEIKKNHKNLQANKQRNPNAMPKCSSSGAESMLCGKAVQPSS